MPERSPPSVWLSDPRSLPPRIAGIYPLLRSAGHPSVLLETLGPGGMSLLAWDPAAIIEIGDGSVRVRSDPAARLPPPPRHATEVPNFLARLLREHRVAPGSSEPRDLPFLGGLVGFVGYEWAAGQEGPDAPRLEGFPDLWFGLFDRAIVSSPSLGTRLVVNREIRSAEPEPILRSIQRRASPPSCLRAPVLSERSVTSSWRRPRFESAVRDVRRRIRAGDVYQVDLALQLRGEGVAPWPLYLNLRERNPSPYGGILETGESAIVSSSPERVLKVTNLPEGGRRAETRPIAGTRPRGDGRVDALRERALRRSPKERAEHTMLVDLSRNDLGRVCALGTVEVDEWLTVERYSHVMHLVSNVRGQLTPSVALPELFRALLPGGSVTGTPKIRATEIISELEPVPRGPYTGSMGYVSLDGSMDFNLLIRSAYLPAGSDEALFYAGAGIVQDSQPDREWEEVRAKAAVLLEAARGARPRGFAWRPPRPYSSWKPPAARPVHGGQRVLLIDNYDSFTYNLAQYLSMLGARVRVVRNDDQSLEALRTWRPTHVVLSPGPGRPHESGVTVPAVQGFEGTPLLGVCLGHQAIVEAYGGSLAVARRPMHGKSSIVDCVVGPQGAGLLADLGPSFRAARYHSLVARVVPRALRVTAMSREGEVMAVEHRTLPTFGVQFHPESLRTDRGITILDRFLSVEGRAG